MGLTAVIGLTGMNVYSLYALHENTVKNTVEKQKRQLLEYTNQVRTRFRQPLSELWRVDMEHLQNAISSEDPDSIPDDFLEIVEANQQDGLYSDIYFVFPDCQACDSHGAPVWHYDPASASFVETTSYSRFVTDGLAMANTRMNALVRDYRWSTRAFFDAQNSMTVALINNRNREIVGYLNFLVDPEYLVNEYLGPKLINTFGVGEEAGIIVWLHDWTKNKVLATTATGVSYSYQKVDFIQNFPDLLDDWNLKVSFTDNPDIAASQASLMRNLIVLGAAVLLLIGAFVFMFLTAQRERELAQRQADFLANVTHELKTPLSVILAAGENLSDGRIDNKNRLKSYGSHIFNESLRLRKMIDRLLDVAKSGNSRVHTDQRRIYPIDFISNYLDTKKTYFETNNVEVAFNSEKDIPPIDIDPGHFHSILDNLTENAVKYSPDEKYIGIALTSDGKSVRLSIEDRGAGIPKNAQKYIFDKFFRVEETYTANTKGHGLGLSIVKDLVHRNHGSINVKSVPNKGTVFTVSFPVAQSHDGNGTTETSETTNKQETEHV